MKGKIFFTITLLTGFLLGSKTGPKPWEAFSGALRRLRRTRLVSRPIESTANNVSGFVRARGFEMSDRAADAVHRKIVGDHPIVIEARVMETVIEEDQDLKKAQRRSDI